MKNKFEVYKPEFLAVYDAIGDFEKGKTYLFIGKPGIGKTSLMMGLAAYEASANDKKVLFFTGPMGGDGNHLGFMKKFLSNAFRHCLY